MVSLCYMLCLYVCGLQQYGQLNNNCHYAKSGGSVVDHELDYQSKDREIDLPLLRSFG